MKEIPLTQGKVAIVDDEDYERVIQHNWIAEQHSKHGYWYAYCRLPQPLPDGRKHISLTEFIHGVRHLARAFRAELDYRRKNYYGGYNV